MTAPTQPPSLMADAGEVVASSVEVIGPNRHGMIAVLDAKGQQMPRWQGHVEDVVKRAMEREAELMAALKALVDRWEPDSAGADRRMWENAVAAISRAEGRAP